jgi:AhpD family alkylhydroperoxidase
MTPRIELKRHAGSGAARALIALQAEVDRGSVEPSIIDLIKVRSSQVNGCAYCIDMHTQDARLRGEREQRLYALNAWRETPFFNDRERAALEWADTLTCISTTHAPDEVYERVQHAFTEDELVALTFAIVAINGWNRLATAFRFPAGSYRPQPAMITRQASG